MCICLILLANRTAGDISVDEGGQTRPPELAHNKLMCFKITRMTGGGVIMAAEEDRTTEVHVGRNVDTTFEGEETIDVLPIREARVKGQGNRTI